MPGPLFQLSIHTTHIGGTHTAALCHKIASKKGTICSILHTFSGKFQASGRSVPRNAVSISKYPAQTWFL